ncbi:MAG: metallophosphoesterase, partial [Clostridiales bacterium]|nr:metallophosphoesterase [Clostridiales bacterium]
MKKGYLSLLLVISMVFSTATFAAGSTASAEAPENFPALWEAGDTKNKIVTISDIHLGIEDRYSETVENLPLLIRFL